jgi:Mrp family chromosome partitioning ATPase
VLGKFSDAFEKSEKDIIKNNTEIVAQQKDNVAKPKNVIQIKESINIKKSSAPSFKKLAPSLITVNNPHSFEAEQFRVLKTSLMFSSETSPPRTIMVTSAVPDEGKSFVASNLAVTYSRSEERRVGKECRRLCRSRWSPYH